MEISYCTIVIVQPAYSWAALELVFYSAEEYKYRKRF